MSRDAVSFIVDKIDNGAPAGAIEVRRYHWIPGREDEIAGIQHSCPCGCGLLSWLPFNPEHGWTPEQTTDLTKLTLKPSIGMFAGQNPYHWHGFLTDGVFKEC
jgi:hypothetical protein